MAFTGISTCLLNTAKNLPSVATQKVYSLIQLNLLLFAVISVGCSVVFPRCDRCKCCTLRVFNYNIFKSKLSIIAYLKILVNNDLFQSGFAGILKDSAFDGPYLSYFSMMSFRRIQLWPSPSKRVKTAPPTAFEKSSYKKPVSIKIL